jgi:hypothetical protein
VSATNSSPNADNRNLRAISLAESPLKAGRVRRLLRRQWPTLIPLVVTLIGILLATQINFRVGALVFSLGVLVATVLRAVLPRFTLGWLYVRTKWIDLMVLGTFSLLLLVLSIVVPS